MSPVTEKQHSVYTYGSSYYTAGEYSKGKKLTRQLKHSFRRMLFQMPRHC